VLVLRWSYSASASNYVEVHAIASISAAQDGDVIIGECEFTGSTLNGFSYTNRTRPQLLNLALRVEATTTTELYVRVRGGIYNDGNSKVVIADQKVGPFSAPASPNSRIDLVYIDSAGAVQIATGTAAVSPSAPDYAGKLVLAEVTVANGATNITSDDIADARGFLTAPVAVDGTTVDFNSSGQIAAQRDALVPKWDVTVCDANNYTQVSDFVSPIAEFSEVSYGSIIKHFEPDLYVYNNSAWYRMTVTANTAVTKTLKAFGIDNKAYVYVDGSLVWSRTTTYVSHNTPLSISLTLSAGDHTIDVVLSDQGGNADWEILGDIVDNSDVVYRST
jgi:hypothetical protein